MTCKHLLRSEPHYSRAKGSKRAGLRLNLPGPRFQPLHKDSLLECRIVTREGGATLDPVELVPGWMLIGGHARSGPDTVSVGGNWDWGSRARTPGAPGSEVAWPDSRHHGDGLALGSPDRLGPCRLPTQTGPNSESYYLSICTGCGPPRNKWSMCGRSTRANTYRARNSGDRRRRNRTLRSSTWLEICRR